MSVGFCGLLQVLVERLHCSLLDSSSPAGSTATLRSGSVNVSFCAFLGLNVTFAGLRSQVGTSHSESRCGPLVAAASSRRKIGFLRPIAVTTAKTLVAFS